MQYVAKYTALILAFIFSGVIKSSPLVDQMPFVLAALIIFAIIYIITQRRNSSFNKLFSGNPPEIFFISSIVIFMIEITGGVDSSVYFLSYFLLFGLPLISTPKMSLLFTASIIIYYIPDLVREPNTDIFLKLGSILLLLPIAYFLSNELMKRRSENSKVEEKETKQDSEDIELNEEDFPVKNRGEKESSQDTDSKK